jgi:hypothetical protein
VNGSAYGGVQPTHLKANITLISRKIKAAKLCCEVNIAIIVDKLDHDMCTYFQNKRLEA